MNRITSIGVLSIGMLSGACSGAPDIEKRGAELAQPLIDDDGDDPPPPPPPRPPPSFCRTTFTVTTKSDRANSCNVGDCSLREAVMAANFCAGHNNIALPAGYFWLNLVGPESDNFGDPKVNDLDLTESVTIFGAGKYDTTIDGSKMCLASDLSCRRVFDFLYPGPNLTTFRDLCITSGHADTAEGGGITAPNGGPLAITRVAFIGNTALHGGGAISIVKGFAQVTDSDFWANSVTGDNSTSPVPSGGAIDAKKSVLSIQGCAFYGNQAWYGGAVSASDPSFPSSRTGSLAISNSTFALNTAWLSGGAVSVTAQSGSSIASSTFDENIADLGGGALYVALSGAQGALLQQIQLRRNSAGRLGGGALIGDRAAIEDSLIEDNEADDAGGVYITYPMTVSRTTFKNNRALGRESSGDGGGFYSYSTVRVDNSTFVGNSAVGYGGAVTLFNSLSSASPSTIINSTLSGNHATSGGAVNNHVGDLYIKNSTLVGNTAEFGAALIARSSYPYGPTPYPRTFLAHTIITHLNGSGAGALCEDEHFRYTGGAVSGISSNQFNLRGDDSCRLFAAGDILFADPQLGPLAQNGGPTLTHAPLLSSPAVNRGSLLTSQNDQAPDCAPIDQRGVVRPQITATGQTPQCDIGAIELQGP